MVRRRRTFGAVLLGAAVALTGCAANGRPPAGAGSAVRVTDVDPVKTWGIEPVSLRRTAADTLVDFRYRVIEPHKAVRLTTSKLPAFLLDEGSGIQFPVPESQTVGTMRQTSRNGPPQAGRIYFMLFANPGRFIQAGSTVSVVVGGAKVATLKVQ
jgi:hypothetical protein